MESKGEGMRLGVCRALLGRLVMRVLEVCLGVVSGLSLTLDSLD